MKNNFFLIIFCFLSLCIQAQNTADETAARFLRESNSLYAVITILVTIFAGIILFLILQDKKISKLEKQLKAKYQ
ncbi:MAG: CcmD family protein [Chitinophagales bacterium]